MQPVTIFYITGLAVKKVIFHSYRNATIKLDEICINKTSFQNFPNDWFNHDVEKYALPFVKKYATHIPIYVNDMSVWGIWGEDNLLSFDILYPSSAKQYGCKDSDL